MCNATWALTLKCLSKNFNFSIFFKVAEISFKFSYIKHCLFISKFLSLFSLHADYQNRKSKALGEYVYFYIFFILKVSWFIRDSNNIQGLF